MAAPTSDLFAVEDAYRAAIARLGIAAAYMSLRKWGTVSANNAVPSGKPWLDESLRVIQAIRWQSHRLAKSYYQLARALETGRSLGLPGYTDDAEGVTLDGLRSEFVELLREVQGLGTVIPKTGNADFTWLAEQLRGAEIEGADENARSVRLTDSDLEDYVAEVLQQAGDDQLLTVDKFVWPEPLTQEQIDRAYRNVLTKEALETQRDKAKAEMRNLDQSTEEAVKKIEEGHAASGSRGAGVADWAGIQGARDVLKAVSDNDFRVKAYARKTGYRPCAFCAMLASRGFVYYSASGAGEGVQYHLNCHCTVVYRWRNVMDLPPTSTYFQEKWGPVTEDYRGKDKLNAWRRWLAQERRADSNIPGG